MKWLIKKLATWCRNKGRYLTITGTSKDFDVYLVRYYVFRSKYFNVFIHHFFRSDRDDMHNHPWNFLTWLVSGEYTERKRADDLDREDEFIHRTTKKNRLVFRRAHDLHQVLITTTDLPVVTVCFTGPTVRDWEFEKNGQLIPWRKYLGLADDAPGRG